jgi:predicted RNA-binding Zn-ribbon protein involved in translation (DUF1610 family)
MEKKISILVIFLFSCLAFSCDNEVYSPIPYAPVKITLDLTFEDHELNAVLACKTFTENDRYAKDRIGFGGILVVNGIGSNSQVNIYAYDMACPVEVNRNVKIKPDDTGLTATCPKCGTVYNIAYGRGNPVSGNKFLLRAYPVSPTGSNRYLISN